MKIHVHAVDPAHRRVAFDSAVGAIEAGWMGDLPEPDRDYYVELAINDRLAWGTDIVATTGTSHRIARDPTGVIVDATLEAIDQDGAGTLRLGSGLVLIDTEGTPPAAGTPVRLRISDLILADTGI